MSTPRIEESPRETNDMLYRALHYYRLKTWDLMEIHDGPRSKTIAKDMPKPELELKLAVMGLRLDYGRRWKTTCGWTFYETKPA